MACGTMDVSYRLDMTRTLQEVVAASWNMEGCVRHALRVEVLP